MKKTYERNANLYDQLMRDLQNNHETEETSVRFASIQSYSAKIDFIFELLEKYGRLPHYLRDDKDNQESAELRKKGNKLFVANRDEEALKMYTDSVAVAEDKTEYLGLAYANRSAVLFRLKLFEECLKQNLTSI
ncbi:hypothetical protein HHI36_007866 [Cryptolaemus montrouzieri]|uniref:Uncharacterized protein n=1 Tax=Cryptolaemus montrouzieri TaxID=559131 RepID=A0ABD2MRP1_9CUCU